MRLCLKLLCADSKNAEQLRWVEKNFEEMKKVNRWYIETKTIEKNWLIWHVKRDGMTWEELRWGERSSRGLRWNEVSSAMCECEVSIARCAKVEVWEKVRLALHRDRAGHVLGQQQNKFAQSTGARACLAYGACKFYRWENSDRTSLRQLSPRLVRALLVGIFR